MRVQCTYTFQLCSLCLLGIQSCNNMYFLSGICDSVCDFYSDTQILFFILGFRLGVAV